ncbi:MAG TPA: FecR domain-containing protein [Puia sp.]|nr:FecR domain-containing protein [Puia sp.]
MPESTLAYLFDRYFRGIATPEERQALMELLAEEGREKEIGRLMEAAWNDLLPGGPVFDEEKSQQILENALAGEPAGAIPIGRSPEILKQDGHLPIIPRLFSFKRVAVAAAILLLIVGGRYFFRDRRSDPRSGVVASRDSTHFRHPAQDVPPGMDGAVLTLADGKRIILDSVQNGDLSIQGSTRIVKQGGRLAYLPSREAGQGVMYNTMTIPRGRRYQLILPDGSHVWLNAASSIRYPAAFTGKDRKVEMTGEAYFEVAKNVAHPFRVKIGEAEVEVLGTHFDIMAYEEESAVKTTLLEGAVKVTRANASHLLKPGQQAQLNKNTNGITVIDDAPLDETVAWKNGMFYFNRASLKTVMGEIARWYDVKIVYEGEIPYMEFGGKIARNSNLSETLKILELSKVHSRIEDKTIIVMP